MSTPYANDSTMFYANGTPIGWNNQTDSYRKDYGYDNASQYYLQQTGNEDPKTGNYIGGGAAGAGGTAASSAQAGYNQAEGDLQNSYNQMQNTNMQNMANRFGGINTSVLNDQTYQQNRNLNQAQGTLANDYAANLFNMQNQQAQTAIQQQNANTQQQQMKNNAPTYSLNGTIYSDVNAYNKALDKATTLTGQQQADMMGW